MTDPKDRRPNALIHESSPYLLQHAYNPVAWQPWGEAALEQAKQEDKLLIISIGYAACHWCHVMESESFEDEVAVRMNRDFVAVKVDREERPDVDRIYMDAAQAVNGRGGWPLNALALPDGRPIYAGTYYPKAQWLRMLDYFQDLFETDRAALEKQAAAVSEALQQQYLHPETGAGEGLFSLDEIGQAVEAWCSGMDETWGGERSAPKFPMPADWDFLLHYAYLSRDMDVLGKVTLTLDRMAMGGIYDQLGGGFARYSTDARWHVPHFEKMLYDNAQLLGLYARAWQFTGKAIYRRAARETERFLQRELMDDSGGFYASLDADSEGEEGTYYVWTQAEIEAVLGEEAKVFNAVYSVSPEGNWESGKNVLMRQGSLEDWAESFAMEVETLEKILERQRSQLLDKRTGRPRPGLDDKMLCSWNALALKGLTASYRAFTEIGSLDAALKCGNFMVGAFLQEDGSLLRNHKDGKSSIHGFLDDYAFTASAFIDLYEVSFDDIWLSRAVQLMQTVLQHFRDEKSGMFYYTDARYHDLILRSTEITDNVIPASNSEMALVLLRLGTLFDLPDLKELPLQMLKTVESGMLGQLRFHANWGRLALLLADGLREVVITGPEFQHRRIEMQRKYLPQALFAGAGTGSDLPLLQGRFSEGKTLIHICRDRVCGLPTGDLSEALAQLMPQR